jgi:hypothetical protein
MRCGSSGWRSPTRGLGASSLGSATMPRASVVAVGDRASGDDVPFVLRPYRRPMRTVRRSRCDGLVPRPARAPLVSPGSRPWRHRPPGWHRWSCARWSPVRPPRSPAQLGARQAVLTWGNDPRNPLYRIPPYRQALAPGPACRPGRLPDRGGARPLPGAGLPRRSAAGRPPAARHRALPPARGPGGGADRGVHLPAGPQQGHRSGPRRVAPGARRVPDAQLARRRAGPLEPLVRERAADPTSGVRFAGALDGDGVADLLRRSAVFVTAPRAHPGVERAVRPGLRRGDGEWRARGHHRVRHEP